MWRDTDGRGRSVRRERVVMANVQAMEYRNTDAEYREICDFLDILSAQDACAHWESGRMNFWRHGVHGDKDPDDRFFRDNARIWRGDGGRIVGLCISEYGQKDLFVEILPAYRAIYPEVFRWVEATWAAGRDAVEIDVFADDAEKIAILTDRGYGFLRHFENKRTYDLQQTDLGYALDEGFTIRAFSETEDFAGRVALVRSAFENPTYSEGRLRSLVSSPDHVDDWDLMVVSPDGTPVSYCVGWRDRAREDAGFIEPVGTHAAYQRRGFARAVIRECFARMRTAGIRTVEIASRAEPVVANLLYDSLSPTSKREVHKYGKTVRPA